MCAVSYDQLKKKENGTNNFPEEQEKMDLKRSLSLQVSTIFYWSYPISCSKIMDDLCFQTAQSEDQTEQTDS